MPDRRHCPWCGADQRADWVLADLEAAGPHPGKETEPFWRTEGVEIPDVYDGVLFWRCPDCGGTWHAWPEGHPRRAAAERYVGAPEKTADALEAWAGRMGLANRIDATEGKY
ncbi:MAG: hypothetical protein HOY79_17585 [Streptomyces sp.]|nr:hypothetical protein [Streptomyces sp.]